MPLNTGNKPNEITIELEYGREKLYQWDRNQRVVLTGVEPGTQIHFSHIFMPKENSHVMIAYEEDLSVYADIPNIFLTVHGYLKVYVFVADGEKGTTYKENTFGIEKKMKPDDYVFTEDDFASYKYIAEKSAQCIADANEFLYPLQTIAQSIDYYEKELIATINLSDIKSNNGTNSIIYNPVLPVDNIRNISDYVQLNHGEIEFYISSYDNIDGVSNPSHNGWHYFNGTAIRENGTVEGSVFLPGRLQFPIGIVFYISDNLLHLNCYNPTVFDAFVNRRYKGEIRIYAVAKNIPYNIAMAIDALNGEVI